MATVAEVISRTFKLLGMESSGNTLATSHYTDALYALNEMLAQWATENLLPVNTTEVTKTLTANDESYTIGSGADIDTTRPVTITRAYLRDTSDNVDYPLEPMAKADYDRIPKKDVYGLPYRFYYDPGYDAGTVYLYPGPDSAYELHLVTPTAFTEFSATSDTFDLPPEFKAAVSYNLALAVGPNNSLPVKPEVASMAMRYMKNLKRLHATPVRKLRANPLRSGRPFDYRVGY